MTQLIVHPHVEALQKQVNTHHRTLGSLVEQRMHITFEELPALRHRYSELFGDLEREVEHRTLEMCERKRLVELFALKLDRGQKLDQKTIELTMKVVFKEFEEIRSRVMRETAKASRKAEGKGFMGSDISVNTDPDAGRMQKRRELQSLYRKLAKQLHPDTRRTDNPLTRTWWELVQRSYERHDLNALRTLLNIVGNAESANPDTSAEPSIVLLEKERRTLERAIRTERERLRTLREEEPYSIREQLNNEAWIAAQRQALEKEIEEVGSETAKCDQFLQPILAGKADEIQPETVQSIWSNFVEDVYLSGRY